jgi:hypothetical protein
MNILNKIDTNKYCKIREIKPKDENNKEIETDKVFLHLGSFMHRTHFSTGDLSHIVNKFWGKFVTFDWPKLEFNETKVIGQILDYIRKNKDKEFIVSWLSFWEIIARDLFEKLTEEEKKQIKLYISISWVSDRNELTMPKNVDLVKKINIKTLKILAWNIWKVDRWWLSKKLKHFVSNNAVDRRPEIVEKIWDFKINKHARSASLWMTPGLPERLLLILNQKNLRNKKPSYIETAIIYSEDDPTYIDPKRNAIKIWNLYPNNVLFSLWEAWHAAFVEQPEKYNPIFESLIHETWKDKK